MANAIVQALEEAAQKVVQAVEDAARSVGKFFSDTGTRLKKAVTDLTEHDKFAAGELEKAGKHADETPHVHGGEGGPSPGGGLPEPNTHRSLGEDPAHAGAYNHGEYETSQRVQQERGVRLERSPNKEVEWVDEQGRTYDAMGPIPSQYFDKSWKKTMSSLERHVDKADFTPFDVTGLTPAQVATVKEHIAQYGDRVFIVGDN